jgi:hypothetical protein
MFCICGRFVEGCFVEEDVLYPWTFCIHGRFVKGCFVEGRLVERNFVGRTFCGQGHFVEGHFVGVPAILKRVAWEELADKCCRNFTPVAV